MKHSGIFLLIFLIGFCGLRESKPGATKDAEIPTLTVGTEQTEIYFPMLEGKTIACVVNQTSVIGEEHLVDSLLHAGFHVARVFAPEHGFRGIADAGEEIANQIDNKTGIPIISLYGSKKKPAPEDLKGIDLVLFDIQDVGARFYTYISTMTYVMEACAEIGIPLLVLDRPNPNGDYMDGPVLEHGYESFVGLHPVPIVYGMTIGEYARMVNGEGWLINGIRADLTVVPLSGYTHSTPYSVPIRPSPNLPSNDAICLYPSLCLFEGTIISVGRGTDFPFQVIGHPDFGHGSFVFTPASRPGAAHPPYEGEHCYGQNLSGFAREVCHKERRLHLSWLLGYYDFFRERSGFFNDYFDKLAGNSSLRQQILEGKTEEEIRKSWQPALTRFKSIREKYLLYPE